MLGNISIHLVFVQYMSMQSLICKQECPQLRYKRCKRLILKIHIHKKERNKVIETRMNGQYILWYVNLPFLFMLQVSTFVL